MKKWMVAVALLTGSVAVASLSSAATSAIDVPPVLLDGEGGQIRLVLDTGQPLPARPLPVKVCDGSDCETYTINPGSPSADQMMGTGTGIIITIGERFAKRPVNAQVPSDLTDGANGWSTPSNSVTGWVDPAEWFMSRSNRPPLEVHYKSLDATSITRVDVCANYSVGQTLKKNISGYTSFSLEGYTSIKYVLLENGAPFRTEDLSSVVQPTAPYGAMTDIPLCGGGMLGSGLMSTISGLTAGRTYKLTYEVAGAGKPTVTATLDFITPGACPTGEIFLAQSPRTYYFGLLGPDNVLMSYFTDATYQWRWQSALVDRLAPIYFSSSKILPYRGDILSTTNLRSRSEKWRYLKDIDDWALVVENAAPITASNVLSYTVFAPCTSTTLKTNLALDETSGSGAEATCTIESNRVVPLKPGRCVVKASVENSAVTSSGLRKQAGPSVVKMNYVFTSVQTQDTADQTRAVLIVNNTTSGKSTTGTAAANFVRTTASGAKATLSINLVAKQTVRIYRVVGGKSTLLKTLAARAGKNTFVTSYRKSYVFVVKDAKGRKISSKLSSTSGSVVATFA